MKILTILICALALAGCSYESYSPTGTDDTETNDYYYSSSFPLPISSSSSQEETESVFPKDLEYVGIVKTSSNAHLVMRNHTPYSMTVYVNYTITCLVNGKSKTTRTQSLLFYFNPYEQKENYNSIDGYYHGRMETISCSGSILSITPASYDESNFQSWVGNYPISTTE